MKLTPTSLALSAVLLMTGSAEAASVINRFSATTCTYDAYYANDFFISVTSLSNISSDSPHNVFCPLNDAPTIQGLAVDGRDGNGTLSVGVPQARICQTDNHGQMVTCTATISLVGGTGTGNFSTWLPSWMLAPLSDPARVSWYATLVITLPPVGSNGSLSELFGFYRT